MCYPSVPRQPLSFTHGILPDWSVEVLCIGSHEDFIIVRVPVYSLRCFTLSQVYVRSVEHFSSFDGFLAILTFFLLCDMRSILQLDTIQWKTSFTKLRIAYIYKIIIKSDPKFYNR